MHPLMSLDLSTSLWSHHHHLCPKGIYHLQKFPPILLVLLKHMADIVYGLFSCIWTWIHTLSSHWLDNEIIYLLNVPNILTINQETKVKVNDFRRCSNGLMYHYLSLLIKHGKCSMSSECDTGTKQKANIVFWGKYFLTV